MPTMNTTYAPGSITTATSAPESSSLFDSSTIRALLAYRDQREAAARARHAEAARQARNQAQIDAARARNAPQRAAPEETEDVFVAPLGSGMMFGGTDTAQSLTRVAPGTPGGRFAGKAAKGSFAQYLAAQQATRVGGAGAGRDPFAEEHEEEKRKQQSVDAQRAAQGGAD